MSDKSFVFSCLNFGSGVEEVMLSVPVILSGAKNLLL